MKKTRLKKPNYSDWTLKYSYQVMWSEDDNAFLASVAEFPLLSAHGNSPEKALKEIHFVVSEVTTDLEESGESIPQPLSLRKYSGKLNVRLPISTHRHLVQEAAFQHVSLNQLILSKLSKS
ncbi:MAG: type II toxin-antitoxin system HicB family antitoxin [Planctomycetota bacterium]